MTSPADPTPQVITEVSWSTNPDATPVWVSLDDPLAATRHPMATIKTSRGRNYERDQAQIGSLNIDLDNAGGDFTPDRAAGLYYPNVTTDKRIRTRIIPPAPYNGTTYGLFDGHINALPCVTDVGGFLCATTPLQAFDYFETLGTIELLSAYDHEVLISAPTAFYPLSDVNGSTMAGNAMPGSLSTPGALVNRGVVGGSYKFGGTALLPADDSTSLELSPATAPLLSIYQPTGGYHLDFAAGGNTPPYLPATGAFSVEIVAAASLSTLPSGLNLFHQYGKDGQVQAQLLVSDTYAIFQVGYDGSGYTVSAVASTAVLADGQKHHFMCTLSSDRLTVRLWIDGVLLGVGTTVTPANYTAATAGLLVGSQSRPGGAQGSWWQGRLAKFAVYPRTLAGPEIATHVAAMNGFSGEKTGARQSRILDYSGFPATRRAIDPGQSTCGPLLSRGKYALPLLQNVNATEQGAIFMSGSGDYTSRDRARTRNTVSRVTLGDPDLPYDGDGLRFDQDKSLIRNIINASRPNGPTIRVKNQASIDQHRNRSDSKTYEVQSDSELLDAANWDLYLYAQPRTRVSAIVLDPLTAPALWQWALGLEVMDRITLINLPSYAPAASLDFIVQKIDHNGTPRMWKTTLQLSPIIPATLRADASPSALTKVDTGLKIAY